jgi:sortase B
MAKRFFSFIFPVKGDTKGEVIRKLISIVAFVVLVVCVVILSKHFADSFANANRNKRLASEYKSKPASSTVSSKYPAGMLSEFYTLYDQNPDIKGFLTIPGTPVQNPVVQSSDNEYYLEHTFDKQANGYGTLFLDFRDVINPQSQSLIIYGHNMADGSMFGQLNKFQEIDTYKTSSVIDFNTLYGDYKWKIFATFMANTDPKQGYVFNYLDTDFSSESAFTAYINEVRARSLFNIPSVDVKPDDKILTLSTCAYELPNGAEREVIMARRVRDGESLDVGPVTWNNTSVGPTSAVK